MRNILIADDIEMNRMLIAGNLGDLSNVKIWEAADGQQAMDLLATKDIDLVLLDLLMPELDGFGVLEAMQADERLRHIPVIIQSQLDSGENIKRALELGAYGYFVRTDDGEILRRDLALKVRNAISAYVTFKAARQELAERKVAEQRLTIVRRRRQLSELFLGLLGGRVPAVHFFRQLQLLGVELCFPLRIVLVAVEGCDGIKRRKMQERPTEWQALEDSMIDRFEEFGVIAVWPMEDMLVVLSGAQTDRDALEAWKRRLEKSHAGMNTVIAASDLCRETADIVLRFRHACDVLRTLRNDPGFGGIAFHEDIGVDRLLIGLVDRPEGDEYIHAVLQPLLDYDRLQSTELTQTLEALLWSADQAGAADLMGIHLKTVQFRRRRIQEILKVDLGDAGARLCLATAVRLRKLHGQT